MLMRLFFFFLSEPFSTDFYEKIETIAVDGLLQSFYKGFGFSEPICDKAD